jgi:RNA polymerase sigma factor (sigma-70 family)
MKSPERCDRRQRVLAALERYEARLTRFATRLLGNQHDARDVVQHAFLRLCDESPHGLEGRLAQWLFTVCRNRAVDILRARGQAAPLTQVDARAYAGREPDPALAAETQDLCQWLSGLAGALPPSQREAVDLWTEGFSYRQIAEITGHSEGNVRVLVHRALASLRQHPLVRPLLDEPAETNETVPCKRTQQA